MNKKHRILVMSHGHPDFSLGGGEIAAYNLFTSYRSCDEVEDAWFLARADHGRGVTGCISMWRPNEYLWEQGISNWNKLKAAHQDSIHTWFTDLIRAVRPTVVHAHHYVHLGVEYLRAIKQIDPSIKIILTLHEFMAICRQNGQMFKIKTNRLCTRESPNECHQCFPDITPEDFWLRKKFLLDHLQLVDHFISPSAFLRERYIQWGIPADRITVIENGQATEEPLPARNIQEGETRNRFGFFGQINPFKGVDVLLKALNDLSKSDKKKLTLEIHGANLEWQPKEFQEQVKALSDPLIKHGCLRWVGPYQPHELRQRMAAVDWVVVPSVWWENSPMVIQEAFALGRPLLVSNIGGMAEKVHDGIDGIHVPVGNHFEWASRMLEASNPDRWKACVAGIRRPITYKECAQAHLALSAI